MNRSQRRWVPLIVVFACDGPAYLLRMVRLGMPAPRATRGLSQALAAIGVPVLVHTVNSPHHARYLRRLGVRGIISDHLVACGGPAW